MSMLFRLIRLNFRVSFGLSVLKNRVVVKREKIAEMLLITFAIITGAGSLISLYSFAMSKMFDAASAIGHPEIILTMTFVLSQMIILFFGIFYIMSSFYFAKDTDILVPLPLRPYQVLGSKFVLVMIYEYMTALPLLLPPIIIYGAGTGQGIAYWIKSIIMILASPSLPLIIASLFIVVIMRFINLSRSKDLLAVLGGLLGVFLAVGINVFTGRMPKGNEADFFRRMLESKTGLIEAIGKKFPPSIWATLGITRDGFEGLGYMALFIGLSVVLFAVLLWLGNFIFYKSVLAGQEVTRKRKNINDTEINKKYEKAASPVNAIYSREWKVLLRTPVYLLNGMAGVIIGPMLIAIMLFSQGQDKDTQVILSLLQNPSMMLEVSLAGLGLMLFTTGMNMVAPTSVSREGQTFWLSKIIPVPPREQMMGKFRQSMAVSVIGIVVTALILAFLFKMPVSRVAVISIIGFIAAAPMQALGLIIDAMRPKLVWTNPQEAIKQNLNGFLGMIVSCMVIAVLAGVSVGLIYLKAPEWLVYLALAVVSVAMAAGSLVWLLSIADKCYRKVEV